MKKTYDDVMMCLVLIAGGMILFVIPFIVAQADAVGQVLSTEQYFIRACSIVAGLVCLFLGCLGVIEAIREN